MNLLVWHVNQHILIKIFINAYWSGLNEVIFLAPVTFSNSYDFIQYLQKHDRIWSIFRSRAVMFIILI